MGGKGQLMNIPRILNESIEVLSNIVDNIEELALLNALNSKMANLVSLKGCLFRQFNNASPKTLAYYGMSFMNSGMNKDYMIDCINDYLLPFIKIEMNNRIEEYKQQYEYEHAGMKPKELKEELDKIRVVNTELGNPNFTGLYREAEQINKINYGSLFIRIGELGDYLDNIVGGDKGKKELYQKLKDIYEGNIMPSIIAGDTKREMLRNIPVQVMLYTDFENLYNEKIREYYLGSLKTGMARRSFIYMPAADNKKLNYPKTLEDKEQAFLQAAELQKEFKNLYDRIPEHTIYNLSTEAKQLIREYQCDCIDYFNNSKDNTIIKLEKKESFWKITKLSVVYSILDNPLNTVVSTDYVNMAIDFYNAIAPSLHRVIEKRKETEIEKYARYMSENSKKIITRSKLRDLNYINGNKFKKFFDEHFEEIKEELQTRYGYGIYNYNGKGNVNAYQLVKEG